MREDLPVNAANALPPMKMDLGITIARLAIIVLHVKLLCTQNVSMHIMRASQSHSAQKDQLIKRFLGTKMIRKLRSKKILKNVLLLIMLYTMLKFN